MPFQAPRKDVRGEAIGSSRATGFPCLVMMTSVPVAWTSSSTRRQRAVSSLSSMCLGGAMTVAFAQATYASAQLSAMPMSTSSGTLSW
jgi:hypothetical protein